MGKQETEEKVLSKVSAIAKKESMVPFYLLLFYIFMEYDRPQTLLPALRFLHLSGITILLLALYTIFFGKVKLKDRQTTLFMALLGLMVIHGPIAVNNYWALIIFIWMTMNFVVFLSLIHFVNSPEKYDKFIKTWLGIHLFLAIIGIIKHGRGIGGFLGDENDLCMTLNMVIPFSFFMALNETGSKRVIYLILTFSFLLAIISTLSRGGFIGLIAAGIYCWLKTKRKLLTALIFVVLAIFAAIMAPRQYWDEVRSIGEQGTTSGTGAERIYTWGIGWQMFLENPIMGVGQGNFQYVFKKYEFEVTGSDEPWHGRSVAGRAAHSIYFTLLPELGIIGMILFLWMVYASIKDLKYIKMVTQDHIIKNPKEKETKQYYLALALEGSLVAYLVSGAFISILYYPNFWILNGLIVSLRKNAIGNFNNKPNPRKSP